MKRLYRRVIDNQHRAFGLPSGEGPDLSAREVVTSEAIASATARLGAPLSKTFERFAGVVGSVWWPVDIYSVEALAAYPPEAGRPSYLVAFATDARGAGARDEIRYLARGASG